MHKKKSLYVVILILILLLAACGGASDPAENSPNIAGEQPASNANDPEIETVNQNEGDLPIVPPREEPNPVNVVISAEEGNTGSTRIEPDVGGTIVITGADGTTYTLSIPPGALLSRETISMTPLTLIDDVPVEHEGALGVLLEPEGLVLFTPAVLTIQVAEGTDMQSLVGFGTYIDGEDFHLKPWEIGESSFQIQISHFSSGGAIKVVGGGELISRNLSTGLGYGYSPTNGQAWFEEELARGFRPTESAEEYADVYEEALKQWFNYTIRDGLVDAAGGVIRLETIIAEVVNWQQWQSKPPAPLTEEEFDQRFIQEFQHMWNGLATAFKFTFDTAERKCQAGDPKQAVRMYRYFLAADKIDPGGAAGTNNDKLWGNGLDRDEVIEQINNCFRFDLDFRSLVEAPFGGGEFLAQIAVSDVDMILDIEGNKIHATVDLPYERLKFTIPGATCTQSGIKGKIRFELYPNFNIKYHEQLVSKLELDFVFVASPQESWNCGAPLTTRLWHAHFADANDIIGIPQDITIELDIDTTGAAAIWAKWDFDDATVLGGHDTSEVRLRHTPGE